MTDTRYRSSRDRVMAPEKCTSQKLIEKARNWTLDRHTQEVMADRLEAALAKIEALEARLRNRSIP